MKIKWLSNACLTLVVGLALSVGACVPATMGPDGQLIQAEPDYGQIRLLAAASVGAWAAVQKEGISKKDAESLMILMDGIVMLHDEGVALDAQKLAPTIKQQIPPRYQALAMVLVEMTGRELDKWNLNGLAPMSKDPRATKIIESIYEGAKMALLPYLTSERYQEQKRLYNAYHHA